jgi:hypothetical protein
MLADLAFYKATAAEAQEQNAQLVKSRDSWKALYESEKSRADNTQGGRIDELQKEVGDLKAEVATYKTQADADRQKIGDQNAQIISLKSGRKWWFGVGALAGAAAGYYVGHNQQRIVTAVTGNGLAAPGFAPPPSTFNFGGKIHF